MKTKPKKSQPKSKTVTQQSNEATTDTSPRVFQREKLNFTLNLRGLDWSEKQKAFENIQFVKFH